MFIIENNTVKVTPEVLLLPEFKKIWEDDTTIKKDIAMTSFSYIEFMCSPKKTNPFYGYEEGERYSYILEALKITKEDLHENVEVCIEIYRGFLKEASPSLRFYESALKGAKKIEDFFKTFSLSERTKAGTPVYKPADVTRALQDTEKISQTLLALRAKVEQELFDSGRTTKNRELNPFEL